MKCLMALQPINESNIIVSKKRWVDEWKKDQHHYVIINYIYINRGGEYKTDSLRWLFYASQKKIVRGINPQYKAYQCDLSN